LSRLLSRLEEDEESESGMTHKLTGLGIGQLLHLSKKLFMVTLKVFVVKGSQSREGIEG
jgi:hypothetical protein